MVLGKYMAYFKLIFLIILSSMNLFAFSAHPKVIDKADFAIIPQKDALCQEALEAKIRYLLDASTLHISKRAFEETSYIYITNQPQETFRKSTPLQGFKDDQKKFLLHIMGDHCTISVVDERDIVLSSEIVNRCDCVKAGKK